MPAEPGQALLGVRQPEQRGQVLGVRLQDVLTPGGGLVIVVVAGEQIAEE